MKPRVQTREAGEKQGNSRPAIGGQGRLAAETVAGWRARRTPLRQADIQRSRTKASPMTARGTGAKGARPAAGSALAFRRILVPIDFSAESTRALKIAASLGREDGGNLLLVHVVGPIYDLRDYGYGPVQRRQPNEGLMRHARQRLQALGRRHVGEKRPWRCVVCSGTAPRQILKAAEEFHAELVVMPTRGLSHAPPTEVGSTAERVVRHAPCPVLVLPKQKSRKRRTT
jgi:universal stress protein A